MTALAVILTGIMAAPVLRAPSERLFGMEIVGRHHDPFSAIRQFERPGGLGIYSQPVTDMPGAWLARVVHPVAAYNWLVLLSFPLSALAAYLLGRHLSLSPAAATVAALAYAFSPFHIAHAAYHPHVAQTQWIPLFLLALWRCLDRISPIAVASLGAATIAVTLSNFYGGFITAVITPVAVVTYWVARFSLPSRLSISARRVTVTAGTLILIAASGVTFVSHAAGDVIANPASFAFPRADVFAHSARWWSYLAPPIAHPFLGVTAERMWSAAGVQNGLLEQQVSLGWGIVTLALIAVAVRLLHHRTPMPLVFVPVLASVGGVAFVCSLSQGPSAFLYDVLPMFRAYARFGVIVQLMTALMAGIAIDHLWRLGTRPAQIVVIALIGLAGGEYVVSPSAMWRDVLPTTAHRWVMQQGAQVRAFDCTPFAQESESVQWLTEARVTLASGSPDDCTTPDLPEQLAAAGYTHLIVRRDTVHLQSFAPNHPLLDGLEVAARFGDAQVFAVTAPTISQKAMTGFFEREHNAEWAWRWMGADARWVIVNRGAQPAVATLTLELLAFHRERHLEVVLDGVHVHTLEVEPMRRTYEIDALTLLPGEHELVFRAVEPPTVAHTVIGNGDGRALSFAFGTWNWTPRGQLP
jgi:hypothetical protein